jgi:hypothetical protein
VSGPLSKLCKAASDGAFRLRFPAFYSDGWRITGPMPRAHCEELMRGTFNYDAVLQEKRGGKWVSLGTRSELALAKVAA